MILRSTPLPSRHARPCAQVLHSCTDDKLSSSVLLVVGMPPSKGHEMVIDDVVCRFNADRVAIVGMNVNDKKLRFQVRWTGDILTEEAFAAKVRGNSKWTLLSSGAHVGSGACHSNCVTFPARGRPLVPLTLVQS